MLPVTDSKASHIELHVTSINTKLMVVRPISQPSQYLSLKQPCKQPRDGGKVVGGWLTALWRHESSDWIIGSTMVAVSGIHG